jgi:hypothetical protein
MVAHQADPAGSLGDGHMATLIAEDLEESLLEAFDFGIHASFGLGLPA